ncbi:MAG TPA: hypothetical protein VF411_06125 [Bacteroidia bacterium]
MKKRKHVNAIFWYAGNVSQFLNDAWAFFIKLTTAPGNTHVTVSATLLAAMQGRINAARAAEAATTTRARGTANTRNTAVDLVITDVQTMEALVQTPVTAATDVLTAENIVTDCGLHTRINTVKTKADLTVANDTSINQAIDAAFKAAPRGFKCSYQLDISLDGITYTLGKVSPDSRYKYVHTHPVGTKLWLRGRLNFSEKKGGEQAYIYPTIAFLHTT